MNRIPLTDIYGNGVNLDLDNQFYKYTDYWTPTEDIDWDKSLSFGPEKQEAMGIVATQFHFGNLTDLMLCGRIMEREPDMNAKRLAILFSTARMRNVDAWGQYLDLLKTTSKIVPPLDAYMFSMYDDASDTLSLLIGMTIIGDISGSIILEEAKQVDEPVLTQMADNMTEQAKKNREHAVKYLRPALAEIHPNRLTKIRHEIRRYRQNLQDIIYSQDQAFETLGWRSETIAHNVEEDTDIFLTLIMPYDA